MAKSQKGENSFDVTSVNRLFDIILLLRNHGKKSHRRKVILMKQVQTDFLALYQLRNHGKKSHRIKIIMMKQVPTDFLAPYHFGNHGQKPNRRKMI